jgi:hypothetical protein
MAGSLWQAGAFAPNNRGLLLSSPRIGPLRLD